MQEDINSILDIKQDSHKYQRSNSIHLSMPAVISFICALGIIPFAVASIILAEKIVYNPFLTAFNGLLFYICAVLAFISILLGFVGFFHIIFKKSRFRGFYFAIGGIVLSVIFFVIYFFFFFMIGFAHAMH